MNGGRPAGDQAALVRSSLEFFKKDSATGNITEGGFWFRGVGNFEDPRSAFFAAGQNFVIQGPEVQLGAKRAAGHPALG